MDQAGGFPFGARCLDAPPTIRVRAGSTTRKAPTRHSAALTIVTTLAASLALLAGCQLVTAHRVDEAIKRGDVAEARRLIAEYRRMTNPTDFSTTSQLYSWDFEMERLSKVKSPDTASAQPMQPSTSTATDTSEGRHEWHGCLQSPAGSNQVDLWPTRDTALKCTQGGMRYADCEAKVMGAVPAGTPLNVTDDPANGPTIGFGIDNGHGGSEAAYVPLAAFVTDESVCDRLRHERAAALSSVAHVFDTPPPKTSAERQGTATACKQMCDQFGGFEDECAAACDPYCEGSAGCKRESRRWAEKHPIEVEQLHCTRGDWVWKREGPGYTPVFVPGRCRTLTEIRRGQQTPHTALPR